MSELEPFEGSVAFAETGDGGDICRKLGYLVMSTGLEEAVYLSLFGGSVGPVPYWANADQTSEARVVLSRFQQALALVPPTTGNLQQLTDAADSDLAWLIPAGVASSVDVLTQLVAHRRIRTTVDIRAEGDPSKFQFVRNWGASTITS